MQQIRVKKTKSQGERPWREILPLDPRDPDVVRIKAAARARRSLENNPADPPPQFTSR